MKHRTVVFASTSGLHARPAKLIVAAATGTGVKIAKGAGSPVDAASILRVMSLGVVQGDEVTLSVDGDDESALDAIAELLAINHDAAG